MSKNTLNIDKIRTYLLKKEENTSVLKQKEQKEIIAKLRNLSQIWEKYCIDKVYLHGSISDLSFNRNSDIDLAIEPDIGFEALLKLYQEINRYFKREVDIRVLNDLPIIDKVKSRGILIYVRKDSNIKK
jgi:predicted nucleotidyltransferase